MFAMGLLAYQDCIAATYHVTQSASFAVKSHFPINNVRDVATGVEKLHHLFPRAC
jgi:hypothetical protein